jgi:hypothetical protein
MARGQRTANPTAVITRLILKTLDPVECLLTETTDMPERAAESKAKMTPSIKHQRAVDE